MDWGMIDEDSQEVRERRKEGGEEMNYTTNSKPKQNQLATRVSADSFRKIPQLRSRLPLVCMPHAFLCLTALI